ALTNDHFLRF
uniref:FMRFAMIDE-related peptide n=1 Tax=Fusinus ferrugineus TaxID=6488 RepID=Q9TWU1_FUSFE|nr:FMRFamide-related peptide [Fusinus ferrugineus=prosobranch mollusc, ganglia, Peptide, 10 aa] [Fusinus ferrugineus]